jgi:hypothetical protein
VAATQSNGVAGAAAAGASAGGTRDETGPPESGRGTKIISAGCQG